MSKSIDFARYVEVSQKLGDLITERATEYSEKLKWAYEEMGAAAPSPNRQRINAYRAGAEMGIRLNHAELVEECIRLRIFIADVLHAVRLEVCPKCRGEYAAPLNGQDFDCDLCDRGFIPRPGGTEAIDAALAKHGRTDDEMRKSAKA